MYYPCMNTTDLLKKAHFLIEAKEEKSISYAAMSERLGISERTYTEYRRGTNSPKAMRAILNLLTQLNDDDVMRVIEFWREESHE